MGVRAIGRGRCSGFSHLGDYTLIGKWAVLGDCPVVTEGMTGKCSSRVATLRVLPVVISVLGMLATPAWAETLPLPPSLVGADSDAGERLFLESDARQAYFPLATNFLTQKYQSYCGVASIVMVLNALQLPAPAVPEFAPYRTFTQDNVLDERTDAVLPRDVLLKKGMTLDQLGGLLALQPLNVEVRHAGDATLDEFRTKAREFLGQKNHFVIINYLRMAIGQERGGHISPLAAYDAETDRFLILDVARYKYPPVWVTASDLFDAMNTPDADNENKTRGYVLIAKPIIH